MFLSFSLPSVRRRRVQQMACLRRRFGLGLAGRFWETKPWQGGLGRPGGRPFSSFPPSACRGLRGACHAGTFRRLPGQAYWGRLFQGRLDSPAACRAYCAAQSCLAASPRSPCSTGPGSLSLGIRVYNVY